MNNNLIQIAQTILRESTKDSEKIPSNYSNPDRIMFDGSQYSWKSAYAAFCFIGKEPGSVLTYITNISAGEQAAHDYISRQIEKAFDDFRAIDNLLKRYSIITNKKLSYANIAYAVTKQKVGLNHSMLSARKLTFSGRIWKDIKSPTFDQNVNVVVFWGKENTIDTFHLDAIKEEFDSKSFFWGGSDSKFFNEYGDKIKELGGKDTQELSYPGWTHEELQELIVRMHTDSTSLTPAEHKILRALGFEKNLSKIYPQGYHSLSRTSESVEESINYDKLLPSNFNTHSVDSCMLAAELITKKLLQDDVTNFKVYEGYIKIKGVEGKFQHTWIVLNNKEKVDPTLKQFFSKGDSDDYIKSKVSYITAKSYTPDKYLELCVKYPVDIKKHYIS